MLSSQNVQAHALPEDWKPRATLTNSKETPVFICAVEECWRLFPDKTKLLGEPCPRCVSVAYGCIAHRMKDHAKGEADLWEEAVSYSEVVEADKLESARARDQQQRVQDASMQPEVCRRPSVGRQLKGT